METFQRLQDLMDRACVLGNADLGDIADMLLDHLDVRTSNYDWSESEFQIEINILEDQIESAERLASITTL